MNEGNVAPRTQAEREALAAEAQLRAQQMMDLEDKERAAAEKENDDTKTNPLEGLDDDEIEGGLSGLN